MLLSELADGIFAYQASLLLMQQTLLQALFVAVEDLDFASLEHAATPLHVVLAGGGMRLIRTIPGLSIESLSHALGWLA